MKQGETLKIGDPLKYYMEHLGWKLIKTHGNQFQQGLPDYYAMHSTYTPKWIEVKVHGRPLTPAQKALFPIMLSHNVLLWIIDGHDFRGEAGLTSLKSAYQKLFKPSNAALYLIARMREFV